MLSRLLLGMSNSADGGGGKIDFHLDWKLQVLLGNEPNPRSIQWGHCKGTQKPPTYTFLLPASVIVVVAARSSKQVVVLSAEPENVQQSAHVAVTINVDRA